MDDGAFGAFGLQRLRTDIGHHRLALFGAQRVLIIGNFGETGLANAALQRAAQRKEAAAA
jgi:hypothetical protein